MARWGEVVEIKPRKSIKRKVRLKKAEEVREAELILSSLVLFGDELSDEAYIPDIMFQYSQHWSIDIVARQSECIADGQGIKVTSV